MKTGIILCLGMVLCSCFLQDKKGELRCGDCHLYPPDDENHTYHMYTVFSTTAYSKPISCYDCHAQSIQIDSQRVLDTIFQGIFFEELHSRDYPDDERIREWDILRIDSLWEVIPLAVEGQDSTEKILFEWLTTESHDNGELEVFMPNPTSGGHAPYQQEPLTCTTVDCHTSQEPYSFEDKAQ